jgi:mono/diheme cytochrome c family protein
LLAAFLGICGCRQDMHDQPRYKPLHASTFFGDERSARPLVAGTVARGHLDDDEAFFTGKIGGKPVTEMPVAVDRKLIDRGHERFDIYCAPCHDRTGRGLGVVVRRGFRRPPSLHVDRLREAPVGYYYDVITNGFGVMQDYALQVAPHDRWAIIAYVRALQLSQHATVADLGPKDARRLQEEKRP